MNSARSPLTNIWRLPDARCFCNRARVRPGSTVSEMCSHGANTMHRLSKMCIICPRHGPLSGQLRSLLASSSLGGARMAFALPGMKSQQDAAPKSHIFRPPASPAHLATANSKLEGRSPWSCTGHGRRQVSIKDSAICPLGFVIIRRRETDFSPPLWILALEPLPLPSSGAAKICPASDRTGNRWAGSGSPRARATGTHNTHIPLVAVGWLASAGWLGMVCLSVCVAVHLFLRLASMITTA